MNSNSARSPCVCCCSPPVWWHRCWGRGGETDRGQGETCEMEDEEEKEEVMVRWRSAGVMQDKDEEEHV